MQLMEMRKRDSFLATVLITGWKLQEDDPRLAAFDFHVQKPFEDLNEVEDVIAQAIELHDLRADEINRGRNTGV